MEEMYNFCLKNMKGDLGGVWTNIKMVLRMVLRISGMQGYDHRLCDTG
jgi:hypothetical protein